MQVFILDLGGYLSIYFQFEGHLSIYPNKLTSEGKGGRLHAGPQPPSQSSQRRLGRIRRVRGALIRGLSVQL